ncbi:ABC transporter substrate-binding protein [Variovorax sp.]|jgi:branched-chain amino acid transport system substrate-binding protein|uniref:ABC transporter substrate-binding protein n=1 Tax=Variovorax sp. TaxID=1871043 RepID=UPI0011FA6E56|nr:ABC transporter substrate-binding protein [Variovorax sp.]TAJ58972.1 MAG: branched-chain amino acid ABC transporter substrate-binding protein [Variovorax sp.]
MKLNRRTVVLGALASMAAPLPALAQKRHGPGVSDSEIRIGSTMPFSGPVSILGTLGKTSLAYFNQLNAAGGINGRRIKLIQYDDGYNPGKALELTRRLVEQDEVSLIFETVGTATNNAIYRYLNGKKVPQLLIFSGANKWNDVANAPFTISGMPTYNAEGRIYARWILENMPGARIAILMQNDDFGRDYLTGIKAGLGDKAKDMIVAQSTYETTDASVDSQVVSLKGSGANVFISLSNGKFTVQSMKKAHDIGWKPQVILPLGSSSLSAIMRPAGAEAGKGAITGVYNKPVSDPQFDKDPGVVGLREFLKKWLPEADPSDSLVGGGYTAAQVLENILRRCGDDLTRENIMKQASSLSGLTTPLLMPGITLSTSEKDHELYGHLWLQRFDGNAWIPFGKALSV